MKGFKKILTLGFIFAVVIAAVSVFIFSPNKVSATASAECTLDISVNAGDTVLWDSGASGDPTFTVEWSGTDGLSGTDLTVTKTYATGGTKIGTVVVLAEEEANCDISADVIASAPTAILEANPEEIEKGDSSTLTWESKNTVSCESSDFNTNGETNGSVTVSPTQTTTYSITCQNEGGDEVSDTATVTVSDSAPDPTVILEANPERIEKGDSSTLSWRSEHTISCTGEGFNTNGETNGSVTVSPTQTTTYSITCQNEGGDEVSDTATVTVEEPSFPHVSCPFKPKENRTIVHFPQTVCVNQQGNMHADNLMRADSIGSAWQECYTIEEWRGTPSVDVSLEPGDYEVSLMSYDFNNSTQDHEEWSLKLRDKNSNAITETNFTSLPQCGEPGVECEQDGGGSVVLRTFYEKVHSMDDNSLFVVPPTLSSKIDNLIGWHKYSGPMGNPAPSGGANSVMTACAAFDKVDTPVPDPTVTLEANPEEIEKGDSSTLTWESKNTVSCESSDFNTNGETNGSVTVSPTQTTTYSITCQNEGGDEVSDTATVTVSDSAPDPTVILEANPERIEKGDSSTLSWRSEHTISCTGEGFNTNGETNGSVTVSPTQTTTYSITCQNEGGDEVSDTATVTVIDSPEPKEGICLVPDSLGHTSHIDFGESFIPTEPSLQDIFEEFGYSVDVDKDQEGYQIWHTKSQQSDIKEYSADLNGDGVVDVFDLLKLLANWGDCSVDGGCLGDINKDGKVGQKDLDILLALWGTNGVFFPQKADINKDGVVDVSDLLKLLANWGDCPSEGDCPGDINKDGVVDALDQKILLSLWGKVFDHSTGPVVLDVKLLGDYASNANVFGYYLDSDIDTFTPIFQIGSHSSYPDVKTLSTEEMVSVTLPSAEAGHIGFAIDSESVDGSVNKFTTELSINPGGNDHAAVYDITDNKDRYLIGFEDIAYDQSDLDFNDLVVEISASCDKPEPKDTPPVITLLGDNPMEVVQGSEFIDPGATAFDEKDGDITEDIVVTGEVDTDVVDVYILSYDVVNSLGIPAMTVNRVVKVISDTPTLPTVTLEANPEEIEKGDSSTLTWNSEHTISCTGEGFNTNGETNGSVTVSPTQTTTYSITCQNEGGDEVSDTVNVKVQDDPTPPPPSGGGGGGSTSFMAPLPGEVLGEVTEELVIFNERVSNNVPGAALVQWETNIEATNQRVLYGTTSVSDALLDSGIENYGYESSTFELSGVSLINHAMSVTGLEQGETYYFRPVSKKGDLTALGREVSITISQQEEKCLYLRDYLRIDWQNNPEEVRKLQSFLKDMEGINVEVTGVFDQQTFSAVSIFQERYKEDILTPWGHDAATGFVYILTKKKVNEIYCQEEFPLTEPQKLEIKDFRSFLESLRATSGVSSDAVSDSGGVKEGVGGPVSVTPPPPTDETESLEEEIVLEEEMVEEDEEEIMHNNDDEFVDIYSMIEEEEAGQPDQQEEVEDTEDDIENSVGAFASAALALPQGPGELFQCAIVVLFVLTVLYLLTSILVGGGASSLSKSAIKTRKLISFTIGLVVAIIGVAVFSIFCAILPLIAILAVVLIALLWQLNQRRGTVKPVNTQIKF